MKLNQPRPGLLIGRSIAVGALVGLLAGALEGIFRYTSPNPPVLLQPDVSYIILLLGPLTNGLAGGFLGLVVGLCLASRSNRIGRCVLLVLGGCLAAFLAFTLIKYPADVAGILIGSYRTPARLALRAAILLAGAGTVIVGCRLPFRRLGIGLAAAFVFLSVGVAVYALRPSMRHTHAAAQSVDPPGEPNIILITLDTLRADHLSRYGYRRRTTPRIDQWARRGVVFDNAVAAASWTLPSHASIFTGLLPHQHGADFDDPLDPGWWTIADVLSSRGYQTAGFTSNFGYGGVGWGLGNGFDAYDDDGTSIRDNLRSLDLGIWLLAPLYAAYVQPDRFDRRDARQINRDVLRWFHHRSSQPFYLFINYYDVHDPYIVPADYARSGRVPAWPADARKADEDNIRHDPWHRPAEETESAIVSYDSCLAFLDDSVGGLLDELSRLPDWNNTIVIITSDHGESFGEHGAYHHGANLYREQLHVPLLIWGPSVPAGHRISHVVRLQELFETVLQFSGMDNPPFQRAGLQRFWRPGFEPGEADESVVSELLWGENSPLNRISLTTSEWQYLRGMGGNEELYRWVNDPGEEVNVAKSPQYQSVLTGLRGQLSSTVGESLRPWRRPEYLSALAAPGSKNKSDLLGRSGAASSADSPSTLIGASQAFFPPRAFTRGQRSPSKDEELLRSLPYH